MSGSFKNTEKLKEIKGTGDKIIIDDEDLG